MKKLNRFLTAAMLVALSAPGLSWSAALAGSYSVSGADGYVHKKDWNGLLGYSKAWTQAEPDNPSGWFYLGKTYAAVLNQPQDAVRPLQRAVALKPAWSEAWNVLGQTYLNLGRNKEAIEATRRAADQSPWDMGYWNRLAVVYSDVNKPGAAVKSLDDGERAAGPYATAYEWYVLGNGFKQLRQYPKAIHAYKQCLGMNSRLAEGWNNLGVAEQQVGNVKGALSDYQRAASLGDEAGRSNYTDLKNAIEQEEQARQQGNTTPMPDLGAMMRRWETERNKKTEQYMREHPGVSQTEAQRKANW
jgi:tetratricopeptide (TPR) repeat protein